MQKASIWEWLWRTEHDQGLPGTARLSWIRILSNFRQKQNKCLGLAAGTLGNTTVNSRLERFRGKFSHCLGKVARGLALSWESTGGRATLQTMEMRRKGLERSRRTSVIVCIHYRFLTPKETITPVKIYYCRVFHFLNRKNDDNPSQRFEQDVCITMTSFWGLLQSFQACI